MSTRSLTQLLTVAAFSAGSLAIAPAPVQAQGWPSWADGAFGMSTGRSRRNYERRYAPPPPEYRTYRYRYVDPYDDDDSYRRPAPRRYSEPRREAPELLQGGARPSIVAQAPPVVDFRANYPADTIIIDTQTRRLFYVLPGQQAYAYDIAVGREGFSWTGVEKISRKQEWPDWHPPEEMRERDPKLPKKMTGGLRNPLGAMALYLGNTLYRIHGTNDEKSIGRAQSSGCFRMMNSSVLHLASIAAVGTTVHVVKALATEVSAGDPAMIEERIGRPYGLGRRQSSNW